MYGPFVELKFFLRVIELGSVRAVARESGVEPSSVSRRMTGLEGRLGTKLLERAHAKTRPTEAGRRFYDRIRVLLAQIDAVEAEIGGETETPRGLLRVNTTIDFGQIHASGWLLEFKRLHPPVDVELTLSARNIDLVAEGVDVAIRIGRQPDSALMSRSLAGVPRVLVAAPSYLKQRGLPVRPSDLSDHEHIFFLPETKYQPLRLTGPDGNTHDVHRRGGVTINAIMPVVEAVRQGFGIHLGPRWAFQQALQAGDVVEVLPDYTSPAMPMMAVWAPAVYVPARIRAFIDFAAQKVRSIPGLETRR
ncbi:MAG: LysR family transcriptional regulator [Pseudomonadota bacterium]